MSEPEIYDLSKTAVEMGGVFRCCLGTVAIEYEGKKVKLGDTSSCKHCKCEFVLVKNSGQIPVSAYKATKSKPVLLWYPKKLLREETNPTSKP